MRLSLKYLLDIMECCCRWSTQCALRMLLSGTIGLGSVMGISNAHATIPKPEGWRLQFGDDFNGAADRLPSPTRWRLDTGHRYPSGPPQWGTGEIQTYTANKANVSLDGQGHLRITPLRDKSGNWTSARIETRQGNFKPPAHGVLRIEARIQMPYVSDQAAQGYWPAFWALGQSYRKDGKWPQAGEFDIMENVNGINSVWGILHCGVYPGGPCGEPNGLGRRASCDVTTCQAAFHVYTFEWDRSVSPMQIRWYVDGKLYDHVAQNQLPAATWNEITGQGGYFLLLNVAMGGGFSYAMAGGVPTPNDKTESGHPMLVDYVAVWTRAAAEKH